MKKLFIIATLIFLAFPLYAQHLTIGGLDYAVNDQLHAIIGYDLFHGDKGMFAVYRHNSEYWVKLKYSF